MTVIERDVEAPALGPGGELCSSCGTPLAADQRYCLNCGERRAEPRVPLEQLAAPTAPHSRTEVGTEVVDPRTAGVPGFLSRVGFVPLAAGACVVLLAVLLGVVIGHGSGDQVAIPASAGRPQVITVATGGAAPSTATEAAFVGDWPAGKKGYSVQLQTLPKDGSAVSAVEAAKSSAESKGAGAVGALDSDRFSSLSGGKYVIYSGVFDTKAQAAKGLSKLKKDFPDAKVIKVASGGGGGGSGGGKTVGKSSLKDLESSSGTDYSKKSRKLPDKLKLPGKPPPTDKKKPGGGGDVQVIGG